MSLDFTVTGDSQLASSLSTLTKGLSELDLSALASQAEGLAKRFAPRDSGRLANSLHGTATPGRVSVASTLPYARVINYGFRRRNILPSLFMQKVDGAIESDVVAVTTTAIEKVIARA